MTIQSCIVGGIFVNQQVTFPCQLDPNFIPKRVRINRVEVRSRAGRGQNLNLLTLNIAPGQVLGAYTDSSKLGSSQLYDIAPAVFVNGFATVVVTLLSISVGVPEFVGPSDLCAELEFFD